MAEVHVVTLYSTELAAWLSGRRYVVDEAVYIPYIHII